MSHDAVILQTTTSTKAEAEHIAESLVNEQWAACVHIHGPLRSVYRWQGKVETAEEYQCAVKTRQSLVDRVVQRVRELHSYDEPEVVVTEIVGGSPSYLRWLSEQLTDVEQVD